MELILYDSFCPFISVVFLLEGLFNDIRSALDIQWESKEKKTQNT